MTDKRRAVLGITALLAVAVIAFSILFTMPQGQASVYRESIHRAEEAYASGNYNTAVIEYKAAIEADETSVPAYEGLSNAYVALGSYTEARDTLWTGYERTNSSRLYSLWFNFDTSHSEDLAVGPSGTSGVNHNLMLRLAGGTFQSYASKEKPVSQERQNDGSIHVRFREVPGTMIFRNSTFQKDAVSGNNISGDALPEEIRLDTMSALLGGEGPYSIEQLETLGITDIVKSKDPQIGDILEFTMDGCRVTAACSEDGTVAAVAYNVIVPEEALERKGRGAQPDAVQLTGTVIDAQTGDPVDDISLQFRVHGDQTGEVLAVGVTGADGSYETDLPPGSYTVELGGNGYVSEYYNIEIDESGIEAEEDFVLTKELTEGEARIVLEWGSTPSDLDSHLSGETDGGRGIHIFYGDPTSSDGNGVIADLDLDDTSSYGPETTTIYNLDGKYDYYVHNFTPSTGSLEGSGATVRVYLPGQSVQTFHVGDGSISGDMWYVCTIDHGKLTQDSGARNSSPEQNVEKPGIDVEEEEEKEEEPESDPAPEAPASLTMEGVGLPFGTYEGYKKNTGDGAIEATLHLNQDMTYSLECIFPLFRENEDYDSDSDMYTYTGTYRVARIDSDGNAVLAFENSVQNFEMKEDDHTLDCEYFFVHFPGY